MPSPKTIESTVAFQDPQGGVLARGTIVMDLSQPAVITGGGQVAPTRVVVTLDANGLVPAGQTIWANDQLSPDTNYLVQIENEDGLVVSNLRFSPWVLYGTSPIDLSTMTVASNGAMYPIPGGGGSTVLTVTPESSNFAASTVSTLYEVTTAASTITGTLLTAVGNSGQTIIFKKVDSGAGTVIVATTSAQTIDGLATYSLVNQWQLVQVVSDGSNWLITGNN